MIAALASFLEARKHGGRWLLRVEDIDPPREQPGAAQDILNTLEAYGFEWDGPVLFQSASHRLHTSAIAELLQQAVAYPCSCSRSDLEDAAESPLGSIYPGFCRNGATGAETAIRIRTDDTPISFTDGLQGSQSQRLETDSGDFIIQRKDGLVAYHLAVVVDDHDQGITDVVRGIDLMDSTPRQIWLQRKLGYTTPRYMHIPVATNSQGQKLSKAHGAGSIRQDRIGESLHVALEVLGQAPPQALAAAELHDIWAWARDHWEITRVRGQAQIDVSRFDVAQTEISCKKH